jgi:YkoY family integral membrane protein
MEAETLPSLTTLLQGADQWGEVLLVLPLLVVLEVVLSADNAIALAAISRRLHDPQKQRQALNLGLLLALVFRILLIIAARWVLRFWPLQLMAATYLLWLSASQVLAGDPTPGADATTAESPANDAAEGQAFASVVPDAGVQVRKLAAVVVTLGLTDLAFSLDSVAAAVAVTDRLVLVMAGGVIGVVALRLTAELFIRWLEMFRHLETSGYLAVALVGIRLLVRVIDPDLLLPEWAVLLSVALLFAWGFSSRNDPPPIAVPVAAPLDAAASAVTAPRAGESPPPPSATPIAEGPQAD